MNISANVYDDNAPSPASSVSQMSIGSEPSPSPSPSLTSTSSYPYTPETPYRYKFYDEYSANLNTASAPASLRPLPTPTHQSEYDQTLQAKFVSCVEANDRPGTEQMLRCHSHQLNINQYDSNGMTPLQRFCRDGDLHMVQLLVRYGADTQLRSREGWAAMHYATFSGSQETVMYVIRMSSSLRR